MLPAVREGSEDVNKSLGAHASSVLLFPAAMLPAVREGSAFSGAPLSPCGCAAVFGYHRAKMPVFETSSTLWKIVPSRL